MAEQLHIILGGTRHFAVVLVVISPLLTSKYEPVDIAGRVNNERLLYNGILS